MAPSKQPQAPFSKDERVLCFHMEMLYEAKILDIQPAEDGDGWRYKIHYKGWKSSWDDWVPADRVRKFTDENKDLAAQLLSQYKNLQSGKAAKAQGKKAVGGGVLGGGRGGAAGSDMSSARGSEERGMAAGAATQSGRGPRRVRDFDLENVSTLTFLWLWCLCPFRTTPCLAVLQSCRLLWGEKATVVPSGRHHGWHLLQEGLDTLSSSHSGSGQARDRSP